jgi:hypothetical protein
MPNRYADLSPSGYNRRILGGAARHTAIAEKALQATEIKKAGE